MKRLFLISGMVVFFVAGAMAQEPSTAAKKKNLLAPTPTTSSTPEVETKAQADARIKAKQKHYEAQKAAANPTADKPDASRGSRKSGKN